MAAKKNSSKVVKLTSLIDKKLQMYGKETFVRERILMGIYNGVSKIPAKIRDNEKLAFNRLPPIKAKIHHLMPVEKGSEYKEKMKIKFVDEDGESFSNLIQIKDIQDVVLKWNTGLKPAMQTLQIWVDEDLLGELRLYAGVLVYNDPSFLEFIKNEGYDKMILFSSLYGFREEAYRFTLLHFTDKKYSVSL